jgi:hypothetical protein
VLLAYNKKSEKSEKSEKKKSCPKEDGAREKWLEIGRRKTPNCNTYW